MQKMQLGMVSYAVVAKITAESVSLLCNMANESVLKQV